MMGDYMKWYEEGILLSIYAMALSYMDTISTYFGLLIGLDEMNPLNVFMINIFGVETYLFIVYPVMIGLTIFLIRYLAYLVWRAFSRYIVYRKAYAITVDIAIASAVTIIEISQLISNIYQIISYLL